MPRLQPCLLPVVCPGPLLSASTGTRLHAAPLHLGARLGQIAGHAQTGVCPSQPGRWPTQCGGHGELASGGCGLREPPPHRVDERREAQRGESVALGPTARAGLLTLG